MRHRRPPLQTDPEPADGATAGEGIQQFFLYGYEKQHFDDRFMHCERIEEQLSRHDWDAKPHVHDGLHQVLYFETGSGELLVEAQWQAFTAPVLLFVPQGTVHGFHFSRDTAGFVLTVARDFMDEVLGMVDSEVRRIAEEPRVNALSADEAAQHGVGALLRLIEEDYLRGTAGRTVALASGLALLLVRIARLDSRRLVSRVAGMSPHESYYREFRELVEDSFRSQPTVSAMAQQLNLTEGRLTAICRAVADASPQQILHARVLIEAKRLLLYTVRPASSIAYSLGFKDPGYFSRFFKRATGRTPREFRHPRATAVE